MEEITTVATESLSTKSWKYSERENKKTTNHTITVTKNRFTHQAEIKKLSQEHRTRTDIALENVSAVNAYYGLARNLRAVIICALFSLLVFTLGIVVFAALPDVAILGIILIVLAAVLVLAAFLIYRRIKPAFVLEIDTYIPKCVEKNVSFAYGSAEIKFKKKKHSLLFYAFLVIVFPIGLAYLYFKKGGKKYVFSMAPEVGNDIVDTIGEFLISK